jgi:hypothetical protein
MTKLNKVLATKPAFPASEAAKTISLLGEIEPDQEPGMFRLYSAPSNKKSYFLIQTKDVDDVYEWTAEELAARGVAGQKMYTVPVRYGTVIQAVAIRNITAGMPAGSASKPQKGCACANRESTHSSRDCNYDSGCASDYPDAPCLDGGVCDACCIG